MMDKNKIEVLVKEKTTELETLGKEIIMLQQELKQKQIAGLRKDSEIKMLKELLEEWVDKSEVEGNNKDQ